MRDALTPKSCMQKAEIALSGARLLLEAGDTDGACSRAYYAMFDAAHAALRVLRVESQDTPIKTHNGLIAKFGQYLVRGNLLAAEYGEALNAVHRFRQLADYSGNAVRPDDASWAVARAEAFLKAIKTTFDL